MKKIVLDTMFNAREFAALPDSPCRIKEKMLFRSDNTASATKADMEKLYALGVRSIVDIRSHKERAEEPDVLEQCPRFRYSFIPFDSNDFAYHLKNDPRLMPVSLLDGYILLLEQKDTVRDIFETIAAALPHGGVLFHCSGGKDRTGLVAMLLQTILGFGMDEILADYHRTYANLIQSPVIAAWVERFGVEYVFCHPDLMRDTIAYLVDQYDSVENYLLTCGVSPKAIQTIRDSVLIK